MRSQQVRWPPICPKSLSLSLFLSPSLESHVELPIDGTAVRNAAGKLAGNLPSVHGYQWARDQPFYVGDSGPCTLDILPKARVRKEDVRPFACLDSFECSAFLRENMLESRDGKTSRYRTLNFATRALPLFGLGGGGGATI